jgi:hypothetical protein
LTGIGAYPILPTLKTIIGPWGSASLCLRGPLAIAAHISRLFRGTLLMSMTFGLDRFLKDVRYRRDRFRQFLGVSFVILVSLAGRPYELLFPLGAVFVFLGIAARLWASGPCHRRSLCLCEASPLCGKHNPGLRVLSCIRPVVELPIIHSDRVDILSPRYPA